MKITNLAVVLTCGATALIAGQAQAGFTGIELDVAESPFGRVHDVYATFDSPADLVLGVTGLPGLPLEITTDGTFYQNPLGNDLSPNPALIAVHPSLAFDTFVTIGRMTSAGDTTLLTPTWPGFGPSSLSTSFDGWVSAVPQGVPINGRVLLGRFTTVNATTFSGQITVAGIADQLPFEEFVQFSHTVPLPGALALLGMAGVVGAPRRRRSA